MNNFLAAVDAVKKAQRNPETWQGDGRHDAQVVFGSGVFTVGDNGDVQDCPDVTTATGALSHQWDIEDQYRDINE